MSPWFTQRRPRAAASEPDSSLQPPRTAYPRHPGLRSRLRSYAPLTAWFRGGEDTLPGREREAGFATPASRGPSIRHARPVAGPGILLALLWACSHTFSHTASITEIHPYFHSRSFAAGPAL